MQESNIKTPERRTPGAMEELARDPASRKRFLKMVGGAGAAGAFATFLGACGGGDESGTTGGVSPAGDGAPPDGGAAATRERNRDPREGTSDLEILNYALTLEYLETAFYARVIDSDLFRGAQLDILKEFGENEREHLQMLRATIATLGAEPVEEPETQFPLRSARSVLSLAAELENSGAAAYLGQANRIRDKEVLAAALSIHSVEARHAATLNGLIGLPPTPEGAFALPASMEEILPAVQRFIAS